MQNASDGLQFFVAPCDDGYALIDGSPVTGAGYIVSRASCPEDLLVLVGKGVPVWSFQDGSLRLLKN